MFSHRTAARAASPRNRRARCDGFCRFCEPKDRLAAKFDFTPALRNSFDRHPYPAWTRFSAPLFCVKPLRGAYSVCRRASGFPSIFPRIPSPRPITLKRRASIAARAVSHRSSVPFFAPLRRPFKALPSRTSIPARRAFLRSYRQHALKRRASVAALRLFAARLRFSRRIAAFRVLS